MRKIALVNQKGGVGKTTSVYNLATALALKNKKVLMVDLDQQASLTVSCDMEQDYNNTVSNLFKSGNTTDPVIRVDKIKTDNLYLIPSDVTLADIESGLINKRARELKLRNALSKYAEDFDYCFIDCPPQLSILTLNALVASDDVIIPCKTDYLSYKGLKRLLNTIQSVKDNNYLNPNLNVLGIIATMFYTNINVHKDVLYLLEHMDIPLLGVIKNSADVIRTVHDGIPVVISKPNSNTAKAYIEIADKIIQ